MDPSKLEALRPPHNEAGASLFSACSGDLFPCDVLAFSILERSLNLIRGFELIASDGGYSCAIGLLRMQLDNLIRFHGVMHTQDPHGIAYKLFSGIRLSKIRDSAGQPMTDSHLLKLIAKENPQLLQIYELASGYIHLSKEHVAQFLSRSPAKADGTRDFTIGDEEHHIPSGHKVALFENFLGVSRGVPKLVALWSKLRANFETNDQLKRRFDWVV